MFRSGRYPYKTQIRTSVYERHKEELQVELLKVQSWVKETGQRIVAIFEGRDAAGKGGTIKRLMAPLNPRQARVVALSKPTEREAGQWYFQRYIQHLPTAGEIVAFDRSWYNRAGVEPVMGFCTPDQHEAFLEAAPKVEQTLVEDGLILLKYWFSVSAGEQERRLQARAADPTKRWKISPIDLKARDMWADYSRCKDQMFARTSHPAAPWHVVPSDDKKAARLNCLSHILDSIPHEPLAAEIQCLPPRKTDPGEQVLSGSEQNLIIPQLF